MKYHIRILLINGLFFSAFVALWFGGAPASAATFLCGNSITEIGETCDDGNTIDGDGCSSTCQKEIIHSSKIVFSEVTDDGSNIVAINPDGSGRVDLTDKADNGSNPVWAPDGGRIAFCAKRNGDANKALYVMNDEGANLVKINETPGENCDEVAWSPDGVMLAYSTAIGQYSPSYKAYKINVDGTGLVSLGEGYRLLWNSDGTKIYMSAYADGFKLTSINPDGSGAITLTQFAFYPKKMSPDGTKMLFGGRDVPASEIVGGGTGTKTGIFYGNPDGSGKYTLIFENTNADTLELYCDIGCAWSPDSAQIVYDKYPVGAKLGILIADSDGSNEKLLIENARGPDWR